MSRVSLEVQRTQRCHILRRPAMKPWRVCVRGISVPRPSHLSTATIPSEVRPR